MTGMSLLKPDLIFIALGTIAVGNRLFKSQPGKPAVKMLSPKDARLDGAFTLFYMSINIGSLLSLSLAPVIADKFGYAVTLQPVRSRTNRRAVGLLFLPRNGENIGSEPDHKPLNFRNLLYVLAGTVVMVFICAWLMHNVQIANPVLIVLSIAVTIIFFRQAFKLDKTGRNKMFVAFILMLEAVVFYVLYAQMPTSLNFFAINNVHHEILGFAINPVSFEGAEPVLGGTGESGTGLQSIPVWATKAKSDHADEIYARYVPVCSLGFLTAAAAGMWFADAQG